MDPCHAAAVHAAMHTAVHSAAHAVATVIGGHCVIVESMSDGNRTVPIKVVKAATNHQGRSPHDGRGVKAPAKRAIEEPIPRQEREAAEPRVPVPARPPPSRSIPS